VTTKYAQIEKRKYTSRTKKKKKRIFISGKNNVAFQNISAFRRDMQAILFAFLGNDMFWWAGYQHFAVTGCFHFQGEVTK
jgi:hypothetical protein